MIIKSVREVVSEKDRQSEHSHPIPSLRLTLPRKYSMLTGGTGSVAPRSKTLLFKKGLQEYDSLRNSRMGAVC
jgi:hypothetical protein